MLRRFAFLFLAPLVLHAQETPAPPSPPPIQPETRAPQPAPPVFTEVQFKSLKARSIGPAVMGGRVSEIAIDPRNPAIFFVGFATGGIFKTGDNGATFDPIFDKETTLSIGALGLSPSDSDILYAGTGEANDRNSSGWGNGVYRSGDGGGTWQNVGLKESRAIGRHRGASEGSEHGLCGRSRQSLGRWRGARAL